jgi:hypothetical protein
LLALLDPTSFVASSGYAAVLLLSVLQSCYVLTSSELTLGFAGVLAFGGKLSLDGAIAAGAWTGPTQRARRISVCFQWFPATNGALPVESGPGYSSLCSVEPDDPAGYYAM